MTTQNQNIMKILIAPDKFKGSLTSSQAAEAIREGISHAFARAASPGNRESAFCAPNGENVVSGNAESVFCAPGGGNVASGNADSVICASDGGNVVSGNRESVFCAPDGENVALGNAEAGKCTQKVEFRTVEIADGGDGSLEVLQKKVPGARIVDITVHDPLGREVPSQVLLYRMPGASARAEKVVLSCPNEVGGAAWAEKQADSCPREAVGENVAEKQADFCQEEGVLCAFIEMAKVSGLEMLSREERNPLHTSTFGMGEAIKAAVAYGATDITLSIGGSATNDGGAGMLQALGYRFFDEAGVEIPAPIKGGQLGQIASIAPGGFLAQNSTTGQSVPESAAFQAQNSAAGQSVSETNTFLAQNAAIGKSVPMAGDFPGLRTDGCAASVSSSGGNLSGIEFKVICDVTNPLLGPEGATAVYGPQKGADAEALKILEEGLANYAAVAERCLGVPQGRKEFPGAGAAGGVGYAGLAFLGAELIPGWRFFAHITSLEECVQWADLVITGEGSLDSQSLSGKVVSGVLNLAAQYNKEVMIFCGVSKLAPDEMEPMSRLLPKGVSCYSIASLGYPLEVCMSKAAALLQQLAESAVQCK